MKHYFLKYIKLFSLSTLIFFFYDSLCLTMRSIVSRQVWIRIVFSRLMLYFVNSEYKIMCF